MQQPSKKVLLLLVYLVSFLYSFHYALPLYIDSSFIGRFLPTEQAVGIIFALSAIITTSITFLFPRIICRMGNYRATLLTMGMDVLALIGLAFITNPLIVVPLFVVYLVLTSVIYLHLDIFVETFSENTRTGGIRGIFLTVLNTAVAIAPFIAGLMLTDHDFWKIYLAAGATMLLGFLIIAKNFRGYPTPLCPILTPKQTWQFINKNRDLRSTIVMHFLLALFYSWMVIYVPLYLNTHVGIPMSTILGFIIPIALIPFILFEVVLGKLADTTFGEKEILTAGFILMVLSTGALSFISTKSAAVWAAALFMTRVGASAVEVMTETYFYKLVGPKDIHIISFMRTIRAAAYIVGPLVGSLVLAFFEPRFLFLALAIILLAAIPHSLSIKDTR